MITRNAKLDQAYELHRRGRLREADAVCRAILADEPRQADVLHLLGLVRLALGQAGDAVALLGGAVQLQPSNAGLHANLGAALLESGRHAESIACFDRAVALQSDLAAAYLGRGSALLHLGRLDQALANLGQAVRLAPNDARAYNGLGAGLERVKRVPEALYCFGQAVTLDPANAEAHHNRGILQAAQGQQADALASIERALALQPRHAAAHGNRGIVLLALERTAEALASFDRAIELQPESPTAYHNRGLALLRLGRAADALASFDHALTLAPAGFATHLQRGVALARLERYEESTASFSQALALDRDSPEALNNRGAVLVRLFRPAEAIDDFVKAIERRPSYVDAHINAGNTQKGLGRYLEALHSFDRALALRPEDPTAAWSKAVLKLALGAFRDGWPLYEARLRLPHAVALQRRFDVPRWSGAETLDGRTLFVHAEQGLGDTLQFCRYIALLEARGARVVFEVQPQLERLLHSLDAAATIIARGAAPPPFDFHIPLLSLPLAFGTDAQSIPGGVPYLHPAPAAVRDWQARLGAIPGFKVGLNWHGNPEAEKFAALQARSFPLAAAAALARLPGVTLVSLQKGAGAEQCDQVDFAQSIVKLTDPARMGPDEIADETAAILMGLDLVITADTALAHLGGALGVPVWLVLQSVADWRWLTERVDSPWYPTLRLFRQRFAGDWTEVLDRVAAAVALAAACGGAAGAGVGDGSHDLAATERPLPGDQTGTGRSNQQLVATVIRESRP